MAALTLPLRTDRLTLRTHVEQDADPLQQIYGRPDVARYLLDEPWTEQVAHERVEERLPRTGLDGDTNALALVVEREGQVIGDVSLWTTAAHLAEISWVLDPAHGGQGYATEAAGALLTAGFTAYGIHRVAAQVDARNEVSVRLCERLGMRREALHLQNWWSKGQWTDTLVYAVLAGEWTSAAESPG